MQSPLVPLLLSVVAVLLLSPSAEAKLRGAALSKGGAMDLAGLPVVRAAALFGRGSGCDGPPAFAAGSTTVLEIDAGGRRRRALVYVPLSHAAHAAPSALQVLFHGLNDNCADFLHNTGFAPHADRDGHIVVSACGSLGLLGVAWNAGTCCGFLADTAPDDVDFARRVVAAVRQGACVDAAKVMAVGFSNGAMLAEVLACAAGDVFAAAASVGGVVEMRPGNAAGLARCDALGGHNASVLMVHGWLDPMVPMGGNALLGFPPIPANVEGWARRRGCGEAPRQTINNSAFVNALYEGCDGGARAIVEVVYDKTGMHSWPEKKQFSTTDYIYNFGLRVFGSY